jgi:hypothetical protein
VTQTTVPIRSGQRQGFADAIYNPTGVTQTIVGASWGRTQAEHPGADVSLSGSAPGPRGLVPPDLPHLAGGDPEAAAGGAGLAVDDLAHPRRGDRVRR